MIANCFARSLSVTERNWFYALLIVIGSGILFRTVQIVEKYAPQVQPGQGLVENASEASMRFFAMSHFIVAFLFLVTSSRLKTNTSRAHFAALFVLGLLFCWGFSSIGELNSSLGVTLFYSYFMIHDFRDQIFFYRANGDAPKTDEPEELIKDLMCIPAFLFIVVAVFFLPALIIERGTGRQMAADLRRVSAIFYWTVIALPILTGVFLSLFIKRRYEKRYAGGIRSFIHANRPLLIVFLGIYAVLIGGLIVSGRGYAIVNLHVCTWYAFTLHHLIKNSKADSAPRPFSWQWMRKSPTGFTFLHMGSAVCIIFLAAIWVYGLDKNSASSLWFVVSKEIMPYWTIVHITTSFLPKH